MAARRSVPEELSRPRIMQAARELFVSVGYRSVSMRSVAKELGYSHGAIYYHFKDKAELFSAIVVEDFSRLSGKLQNLMQEHAGEAGHTGSPQPGDQGENRNESRGTLGQGGSRRPLTSDHPLRGEEEGRTLLERIFIAYIRFGLEHKAHYEIMFLLDETELSSEARTAKMQAYEQFAAAVNTALQETGPGLKDVMSSWVLFLSLHGFVTQYLHSAQTYKDLRNLAFQYAAFLAGGLKQMALEKEAAAGEQGSK